MPYSDGHEEPEVVEYRNKFISELKKNKDLYYTVCEEDEKFSKDLDRNCLEIINKKYDDLVLTWKIPIRKQGRMRRILLCHDESTFKAGEMSKKRWRFGNNLPLYSKGRGRSNCFFVRIQVYMS